MRRVALLLGVMALSTAIYGCTGKETLSKRGPLPAAANDNALTMKYLTGIQNGDKNAMYAVTNLTPAIVDACKEKLIHQSKKLTEPQRKDCEKALEASGAIDFYSVRIRKNLPKSSSFQVTDTKILETTSESRKTSHSIKITYSDPKEALKDKDGRAVKEMIVPLKQTTEWVQERWVQNFLFGSRDEVKVLSFF
jgi:hypothetical protein